MAARKAVEAALLIAAGADLSRLEGLLPLTSIHADGKRETVSGGVGAMQSRRPRLMQAGLARWRPV